jgi:hypothetical protein
MKPLCCVSSDAGVRLSAFDEGRLEPGVQAIAHLVSENSSVSGVWMLERNVFLGTPPLRAVTKDDGGSAFLALRRLSPDRAGDNRDDLPL